MKKKSFLLSRTNTIVKSQSFIHVYVRVHMLQRGQKNESWRIELSVNETYSKREEKQLGAWVKVTSCFRDKWGMLRKVIRKIKEKIFFLSFSTEFFFIPGVSKIIFTIEIYCLGNLLKLILCQKEARRGVWSI